MKCPSCGKETPCRCTKIENTNNPSNTNKFNPVFNPTLIINANCPNGNLCDCSANLNHQEENFTVTANICPCCQLKGSNFSFVLGDILFTSTSISFPACLSDDEGTTLNVSGTGVFTSPEGSMQVTFSLSLFDTAVGDDIVLVNLTSFDENGNFFLLLLIFFVPDGELTITSCNSCNSSCMSPCGSHLTKTSQTSNLLKLRDKLNKGKLIIIKNKQVDEKEL